MEKLNRLDALYKHLEYISLETNKYSIEEWFRIERWTYVTYGNLGRRTWG